MSYFGNADITAILADVGVLVTVGLVSSYGILDLNDQVEQIDPRPHGRGTVVMRAITLVVQTSMFPTITIDTAIVAADPGTGLNVNYVVVERLSEGDGALTKWLLRRA